MSVKALAVGIATLGGLGLWAPRAEAQPHTHCRATILPFDDAGVLLGWRDSTRFAAPLATRDGAGCLLVTNDSVTKSSRVAVHGVWPTLRIIGSGGLPDSRSDGALWAGRGLATLLRTGVILDLGPVHAALAPELWTAENRPYDLQGGTVSSRSSLASPFYTGGNSLDLPSRMGVSPLATLSLGQSALWMNVVGLEAGLSSANSWWGPGRRDGLLLGPGAAGVPRTYLRTSAPRRTPLGLLSGEWFIGTLTESRWFDRDASNDRRSLSAAQLRWSPISAPAFTVGIARAVQRINATPYPREMALDVFRSTSATGGEQMASLFSELALPGLVAYAEITSSRPPSGIRALLATPGDDRAYQLGAMRRIERGTTRWLLHAEVMNTDPGISIQGRPRRDVYAGTTVPQGWTQRGQLLGAGIGPGGTSQWLSVDRAALRWTLGVYAERVRWNNGVLPHLYLPLLFRHDVTARGGVRSSAQFPIAGHPYVVAIDASWGTRLNYLFQNTTWIWDYRTVDVRVPQLKITFSPSR